MPTQSGKNRRTLAATAKSALRIIQSIPSPKAEPFKQWLAQVGSTMPEKLPTPSESIKQLDKPKKKIPPAEG